MSCVCLCVCMLYVCTCVSVFVCVLPHLYMCNVNVCVHLEDQMGTQCTVYVQFNPWRHDTCTERLVHYTN